MSPTPARITIAVPTFRRPQLLRRALESVARQCIDGLEVIVADNATEGDEVAAVVEASRMALPQIRFFRHERNIGPLANFMFCLAQASGEYFMWLADDDELAPGCVAKLAAVLDADPGIVTAVPRWHLMRAPDQVQTMPVRDFRSPAWWRRTARYGWSADDAFFYALHRAAVLRQASVVPFCWPNREQVANLVYGLLVDLVIRGRVVAVEDPCAFWVNREYGEKTYARDAPTLGARLRHIARRANLQAIYVAKIGRMKGPLAALAFVPIAVAAVLRDAFAFAWRAAGLRR